MKHLLSALSTRKIPLEAQESDLRALLSQAQRLRGDSKGGETWEETLEKVLVELRSMEYAAAFLKPVKKSEAWDYDRADLASLAVIFHPMDLQTMGRKIKSHSYMSKKAFHEDLNLIWDNCLTYNTDLNHPLRRAAQIMRKKADQIMRRIPDRNERFAPSMIEKFKFAPPPSTPSKSALPNGVTSNNQVVKQEPGLVNGAALLATPSSSNNALPTSTAAEASDANSVIRVGGTNISFEDRPALERTSKGMGEFVSLDGEMDDFLTSWDSMSASQINGSRPRSSSNLTMVNGSGRSLLDVNQRLGQLIRDDDELAVWKVVNENLPNGIQHVESISDDEMLIKRSDSPDVMSDSSKKRKSRRDDSLSPRKRPRLEKIVEPERNPLENWWHAMGSTSMLSNAVPASFESGPVPNPLFVKHQRRIAAAKASLSAMNIDSGTPSKRKKRRKMSTQETKKKPTLFRLMSKNIKVRKRARDIAIRIADQIEDEKQGVDPEDLAPLIPLEESTPAVTKTWAHRAGLSQRRQQEYMDTEISAAQAQDCMETTAMLILEHSNFDSSSISALRVMGDLAGRCLQNLGKSLKTLHETHDNKMTAEEMVLHALFSNSIGSMHDLESYVKGDIVKHGSTLSNMLTTLEEVATKKDEPVDEEAMLKGDNEVMAGLGDLGEDIYGFRESGIEAEFNLRSLIVPKSLLRPKVKVVADDSGVAEEVDKYPAPPVFEQLETKRIDSQIGLLRNYYQQRIAALIPPPPPRPPTPQVIIAAPVIAPKPPTPEPAPPPVIAEVSASPAREPTPPPAPIFDPYNPSALSIVVPKLPSAPAVASTSPAVAPPALPHTTSTENVLQTTVVTPFTGLGAVGMGVPPSDIVMAIPIELPPVLEDDLPDPSRVKVGPLGQIHVPSAATVAKQKRQHKAAAQAKAVAAAAAAAAAPGPPPPVTPTTSTAVQSPTSATKPKKPSPKKSKKLEAAPPTATV